MTIIDYLKQQGYNTDIRTCWQANIDKWDSWYRGKVKDFHNYDEYNGERYVSRERLSMQGAKRICERWADTVASERLEINVDDPSSNEQLQALRESVDFQPELNGGVEYSYAMGLGALVNRLENAMVSAGAAVLPSLDADLIMDFVPIQNIYPQSFRGKAINEVVFTGDEVFKGQRYTVVSAHMINAQGNYEITNKYLKNSNGNLAQVEPFDGAVDFFNTGSPTPLFAMIRPAGFNNIQLNSCWGVSVFAQAIDTLKTLDICFDSVATEMELGKKVMFLRQEMMTFDEEGKPKSAMTKNERLIRLLPSGVKANEFMEFVDGELRITPMADAINLMLSITGDQVGFGKEYSLRDIAMQTATAVVSQQSDMFKRKEKHERALKKTIIQAISSLIELANRYCGYSINPKGLTVKFDDSIIEDVAEQKRQAMAELMAGILLPWEYRMMFYGETEEQAKAAASEIQGMNDIEPLVLGGRDE